MAGLQAPIINWQVKAGDSNAGFGEHKVLLIAQGNGTAPANELIKDIQRNEVEPLCGAGSMVLRAYTRFRKYNQSTEIDVLPIEEPPTGVKAQGAISVSGEAEENKTLYFVLGDDEYTATAVVTEGMTSAEIAEAIKDAINDKSFMPNYVPHDLNTTGSSDKYPFTAEIDGADTSLVLITFDWKGEMANGLRAKVQTRVLGCEFTSVAFTGGAGAYDLGSALDSLTERYHTVLFDSSINPDTVSNWLDARINVSNTVKGGIGITYRNGTLSDLKDYANAKNSQTLVIFGNPSEMQINALPMLAAAEFGAKRSLRLTDGAVLGDLVLEAQEAFGGISKSSLPYHNTPMSYTKPEKELIIEQVQDLNDAGISLFLPSSFGVVLGTVVTTYKYNNSGIADGTFKYLNAMDTSLAVQEYLYVNSQKEFGQTRATNGDLVSGVAMTNSLSVWAYIVSLYQDMVEMALVQGGKDALKSFKQTLTVDLDAATGVYSVYAPVAIVSQFRGLNGVVAISYDFS